MNGRLPTRLLLLLLFALSLGACTLQGALPTGRAWGPEGLNPDETIFLSGSQPRTLDPATTLSGPDDALGHVFSGLVVLDQALQVQPELAAGWDVSEDGLLYTFYLLPEARFHDGRALTAADVRASWERAADPATASDTAQTYLGNIAGVNEKLAGAAESISGLQVVDDHTLAVRLTAPDVTFLAKLAYPVAYVVDTTQVDQPGWEHRANGSGPFRLQTWRDDEVLILARNEDYYRQPAAVSHVVYDLGPGLPLSQYETGQIDLVGIGSDTLERVEDPNSPLNAELQTVANMCTSYIGLNNLLSPFDDVRVRQAFNYALDKQRLIDTFAGGNALPAQGPLPPGMPGYGGLPAESYPYDVERARALLAEAGYADPADLGTLTFTTQGYGDVGAYITAVITLWQEALGVAIEPVVLEPFTYLDALYAGEIGHFFSSGWCADYPDPQNFLDVLYHSGSTQNLARFSDPEIDALLDAARVEQDVHKRLAQYQAIERLVVAAAPVVFTSHSMSAVLVKPALSGFQLTPIGIPQWHLVSKRANR